MKREEVEQVRAIVREEVMKTIKELREACKAEVVAKAEQEKPVHKK